MARNFWQCHLQPRLLKENSQGGRSHSTYQIFPKAQSNNSLYVFKILASIKKLNNFFFLSFFFFFFFFFHLEPRFFVFFFEVLSCGSFFCFFLVFLFGSIKIPGSFVKNFGLEPEPMINQIFKKKVEPEPIRGLKNRVKPVPWNQIRSLNQNGISPSFNQHPKGGKF